MTDPAYDISSRAHLGRASALLTSPGHDNLFYAAFELRCGIESRMAQYLDVWDHISKKKKKGWRIAHLGRSLEEEFRLGDKIVRWAVHDGETREPIVCLYHTPVTAPLRKCGEQLGSYLHSQKRTRNFSDPWWENFRSLLGRTRNLLQIANTGTLLGPPLIQVGTNKTDMRVELLPNEDAEAVLKSIVGRKLEIDVDYIPRLPKPTEPWAHVWTFAR